MSPATVHIVGAGLGGLTLAKCLQKSGVPVIIYEKASSAPRHFYGITLHRKTFAPLLTVLGLDERSFQRRVAVDAASGGRGCIKSDLLAAEDDSIRPGSFRASRSKLETLLQEDLNIRWEHSIDRLQISPGQHVTLTTNHGENVLADVVIGADGPHSRIRTSLLPKAQLKILPTVAINGKRKVARVEYEEQYAPALQGGTTIEAKSGEVVLSLQVAGIEADNVYISWNFSRPARSDNDPLFSPGRSPSQASDIPEQFFDEISKLDGLPDIFAKVLAVDQLRQDRKLSWLMRSLMVDKSDLLDQGKKGIFFLGDAVHAQPILGGQGANAAIEDGITLAEQITKEGASSASLSEWVESRYEVWREGVQESERSLSSLHKSRAAL